MQVQERSGHGGSAHTDSAPTVSERLADYLCELRYEDLPDDVVTKVKELLVHHLGLAFRGHVEPAGQQAVHAAQYLSGPSGSCTVIGESQPATLLDAVFVNSFLMTHLGMDDFLMPPGVHPGVLTHPVGLAVGEMTHASGRDYITAVVGGYDILITLARAMFPWHLPFPRRTFMLYGPFASAAVAAHLLRLSRAETAHALALAAHGGMGLIEGDLFEPIQSQVARNGVMAAVLAREGMQAASTTIEGDSGLYRSHSFEVPDELEAVLKALGDEFEITKTETKRYASSGINIVPMELTMALVNSHNLRAENVARIDVVLPRERETREKHWESTVVRGQPGRTVRVLIAGVVTTGKIDPPGFVPGRDGRLDAVHDKVHLHFEPDHPSRFCRIEITTTGGERLVTEGEGHVFPPVAWDDWLAEGGRQMFSADELARLLGLVQDLEQVENMQDVTRCLIPHGT
jgi:2-methylcitrate dehydratase PrpD